MKTAEEMLWSFQDRGETDQTGHPNIAKVYLAMKEFAKQHVTAALKAASERVSIDTNTESVYQGSLGNSDGLLYANETYSEVNMDSILNAYPLENVQ